MRKLVLGIIALVSVQFAFVTYMMVLQAPVELTDASEPTPPRVAIPNRPRIEHFTNSEDILRRPEAVVAPAVPNEPPHTPAQSIAKQTAPEGTAKLDRSRATRTSRPAFDRVPSNAVARAEFENVVIRYDRNGAISDCERKEIPRTKKRSYIAKAVPVIKKPWDWLKAIGSKFN